MLKIIINKKTKPYGFIYITTNLINGKKYIGQKKYDTHSKTYLGSGVLLKRAVKRYGKENFKRDIICECKDEKDLNDKEIYYIKFYNAVESGEFYNIADGGKQENNYAGKSEEELKLIKLKISKSLQGKNAGINHYLYGKTSNYTPMFGKHHSKESKIKISKSKTNPSSHTRQLMSQNHYDCRGSLNPSSRKILCINTYQIFDTIKSASEYYKCSRDGIINCCKGRQEYSGKLHNGDRLKWTYIEDFKQQIEIINIPQIPNDIIHTESEILNNN